MISTWTYLHANHVQWRYEMKPGTEGPGPRRRGQSDDPIEDLPVGQLLGPAGGPWIPAHEIAEREALRLIPDASRSLPIPSPSEGDSGATSKC